MQTQTICPASKTPAELAVIAQVIEQVMPQLQAIEQGQDIRPMRYNARLCWEKLYQAREILRGR